MMTTPVLSDGSNKRVIVVDLDDLGDRAARMAERAQQVYDELDAIEQEVNNLDDDWSDTNSKRFLTYFINNHSAYIAQAGYLASYAEVLGEVKRLYEGLEDEIDALTATLSS